MFGIRLMFLLAVMGGLIAFIADKLGSKIGKKKLSVFGLRPHDTSVLLTVLSGVLIALFSIGILAISSESARTALFGMEKLQKELFRLLDVTRRIGVSLSESGLMVPQKSVTALIGVSDRPQPKRSRGCETCTMFADCASRKDGKNCGKP